MKTNIKSGMSLIVLVITIIVMIILAATIIISLQNAGIIGAAHNAVCMTNIKQAQNLAVLKWAELYTKGERDTEVIKEEIIKEFNKNKLNADDYNIEVTTGGVEVSSKAGCVDSSGVEGGAAGKDENIDLLKSYIFKDDSTGRVFPTELSGDLINYKENTELGIAAGDVKGTIAHIVEDGVMLYIEYQGGKYKFKVDSNMNTVPSYGLVRIEETDWLYAFSYNNVQNTWEIVPNEGVEPTGAIVAKIYSIDETAYVEQDDDDDILQYQAHKMIVSGTGVYDFNVTDYAEECNIAMLEKTGAEVRYITSTIKEVVVQEGITGLGDCAFGNCYESLEKITIPNNITSIGKGAFAGCKLKQFNFPQGITRIEEYTFFKCAFESIVIPDSVTYIDSGAFAECKKLKNITISKNLTGLGRGVKSDAYGVFEGCELLETITIPGTLQLIPSLAFSGCTNLKTVVISEGVQIIGSRAFGGCTSLKEIILPSSLEEIGDNMMQQPFEGCSALTTIKYRGTEEQWNAITSKYIPSTATIVYNYTGN